MDIFIHKPLETLVPFISFITTIFELVVLLSIIPAVFKFIKNSKDLYISYGLVMIFFGIYSAYLFSKAFVTIKYDQVINFTFLGITLMLFSYNMMGLRKVVDESFEISKSYRAVLSTILVIFALQIPINNIFLTLAFSFISLLVVIFGFKKIVPSLKLKRGRLSLLLFVTLFVSIILDFGLGFSKVFSSLLVLGISILMMPFIVYVMVEQYTVVQRRASKVVSYLDKLSESSKDLAKAIEEISSIKLKMEKTFFSIGQDINKFVNKLVPTSSKLYHTKDQIVTLKNSLMRMKEKYEELPEVRDRVMNLASVIKKHIGDASNLLENYNKITQDVVSSFSLVSVSIDSIIQNYRSILELLISQKNVLVEIDYQLEKMRKNISLVGYISISGMIELEKTGDMGIISIYGSIKGSSEQIYNYLIKIKGMILKLISLNDDLTYLGKDIMGRLYGAISLSDLIVNEAKQLIVMASNYKEDIYSLEIDKNNDIDLFFQLLIDSKNEFEHILSEVVKFVKSLSELSDVIVKANDFIKPLKNALEVARNISKELDKKLRDVMNSVNQLSSKIVY